MRVDISQRLDTNKSGINGKGSIPNISRKNSTKIVGDYITAPLGTLGIISKRLYIIPFQVSKRITLSNFRVNVTNSAPNSSCEIGVYTNIVLPDGSDNPNELVHSVIDLSTTSTGDKTAPISYAFNAEVLYWIGIICVGAPTLRALTVNSMISYLGRVSASNNSNTHLYKNLTVSNLPIVGPTDLIPNIGNIPAIYLVE